MVLKRRRIYDEIVSEITGGENQNPMEIDEGEDRKQENEFFLSGSGPGIL
jgi:hypothetical protein